MPSEILPPNVHFAIDLSRNDAFTWAYAELALALHQINFDISIESTGEVSPTMDTWKREILKTLIKNPTDFFCHIKNSHHWPTHLLRKMSGQLNLEFFCTNYLLDSIDQLDLWYQDTISNGYNKIAISDFNRQALLQLGIPDNRIQTICLGYATEIDQHFSNYQHQISKEEQPLRIFHVTNSFDLYRYGTDIFIRSIAEAFRKDSNVEIHIKDYGTAAKNTFLHDWITEHRNLPKIIYHQTFISKLDLIKLYSSMDLLVAPFRGEGFGMKIIDAMALGLPVIMPHFGGPVDFATADNFIPLDYQLSLVHLTKPAEALGGKNKYWCEVKIGSLIRALKESSQDRPMLRGVGQNARGAIFQNFSWGNSGRQLIKAVNYFSDSI